MKEELTTDEYLQGLGLWTMMTHHKDKVDEYQKVIIKFLDVIEDNVNYKNDETSIIYDNTWEDGTAMSVWEGIIKEQGIKVTGVDRKHVRTQQ